MSADMSLSVSFTGSLIFCKTMFLFLLCLTLSQIYYSL